MVEIYDDLISPGYQDFIERTLSDPNYPWHYTRGISLPGDNNTGFSHTIFHADMEYKGPYADMLMPLLYQYLGDKPLKMLYRIRAAMFIKRQNEDDHLPHIDQPDKTHRTMIYYVNDSDGPTNIWENDAIVDPVEFKRGRIIVMPGTVFHSSSSPQDHNERMVINYNFL